MNKTTGVILLLCTGIFAAGCEKNYSVSDFKKNEKLREEWIVRCGWTGTSKNCENVRVADHQLAMERQKQAQERRRKELEEWRRTAEERRKKEEKERAQQEAKRKAQEEKMRILREQQSIEADKNIRKKMQELIEQNEKQLKELLQKD
ncbi:EexN family lipoprotein [Bartonella sp. B30(2025)]